MFYISVRLLLKRKLLNNFDNIHRTTVSFVPKSIHGAHKLVCRLNNQFKKMLV